jgi:hypothetical protein
VERLKTFGIPLVAVLVLGGWYFVGRPLLEHQSGAPPPGPAGESTAPAGRPVVQVLDPQVEGALGAAAVRGVIEQHLAELHACYADVLASEPGARGRLLVQVVIREDGSVRAATIAGSQLRSQAVESCFERKIARFAFPSAEASTRATCPFQLGAEAG